jgi:hypothetical protein
MCGRINEILSQKTSWSWLSTAVTLAMQALGKKQETLSEN